MKNWKFKLNDNIINLKDEDNSIYIVGNTGSGKDVTVEALLENTDRKIDYVHVFEAFRHMDVGHTIGIQEDSVDTFAKVAAMNDFIEENQDNTHVVIIGHYDNYSDTQKDQVKDIIRKYSKSHENVLIIVYSQKFQQEIADLCAAKILLRNNPKELSYALGFTVKQDLSCGSGYYLSPLGDVTHITIPFGA